MDKERGIIPAGKDLPSVLLKYQQNLQLLRPSIRLSSIKSPAVSVSHGAWPLMPS